MQIPYFSTSTELSPPVQTSLSVHISSLPTSTEPLPYLPEQMTSSFSINLLHAYQYRAFPSSSVQAALHPSSTEILFSTNILSTLLHITHSTTDLLHHHQYSPPPSSSAKPLPPIVLLKLIHMQILQSAHSNVDSFICRHTNFI